MAKKILSLGVAFVMLSVSVFSSVYATEGAVFTEASGFVQITESDGTAHIEAEVWDGSIAQSVDQDVNGTYLISNGAELAKFAELANANPTINAKLDCDINMGGESVSTNWSGKQIKAYTGTFDGQGHIIEDFYLSASSGGETCGLFQEISGGTVQNIKFENAYITSKNTIRDQAVAIVCGLLTSGKIENISTTGQIYLPETDVASLTWKNSVCCGSIAALNLGGNVKRCYSEVTIEIPEMGEETQTEASANNAGEAGTGGIVGFVENGATVEECGFNGSIVAPKLQIVGGVAGGCKGTIKKSYNAGKIIGAGRVGGVIGLGTTASANATSVYNTGNVKGTNDIMVSGISNNARTGNTFDQWIYNVGEVSGATENNYPNVAKLFCYCNSSFFTYYNWNKIIYRTDDTWKDGKEKSMASGGSGTRYVFKDTLNTKLANKGADPAYPTGLDIAGFKLSTTVDRLNDGTTNSESIWSQDIGINAGFPIYTWQKEELLRPAGIYEIASDKNLGVKTAAPVKVVTFNVTPLENDTVTIAVADSKGNVLATKEIAGTMGIENEATLELSAACEEITVSTTGRALIAAQLGEETLESLASKPIKANLTIESEVSGKGVIILALFDGDVLAKISYTDSVELAEGTNEISSVIDLADEVIDSDCVLRAFVWTEGTLAPVTATEFILR